MVCPRAVPDIFNIAGNLPDHPTEPEQALRFAGMAEEDQHEQSLYDRARDETSEVAKPFLNITITRL